VRHWRTSQSICTTTRKCHQELFEAIICISSKISVCRVSGFRRLSAHPKYHFLLLELHLLSSTNSNRQISFQHHWQTWSCRLLPGAPPEFSSTGPETSSVPTLSHLGEASKKTVSFYFWSKGGRGDLINDLIQFTWKSPGHSQTLHHSVRHVLHKSSTLPPPASQQALAPAHSPEEMRGVKKENTLDLNLRLAIFLHHVNKSRLVDMVLQNGTVNT